MESVVSQQNIFIDSQVNIIGDGTSFKIQVPPDLTKANQGQKLKVVMTSFDARRSFYEVNQYNNKFYIRLTDNRAPQLPAVLFKEVRIRTGTYETFDDLALAIKGDVATGSPIPNAEYFGLKQALFELNNDYKCFSSNNNHVVDVDVEYESLANGSIIDQTGGNAVGLENSRFFGIKIHDPPRAGWQIDFVSFQNKAADTVFNYPNVSAEGYFGETHEILGGRPTRDLITSSSTGGVAGSTSTNNGEPSLSINNSGSGYANNTEYHLTGGSGEGAKLTTTSTGGGGSITNCFISVAGKGYKAGDVLIVGGGNATVQVSFMAYDACPCTRLLTELDISNGYTAGTTSAFQYWRSIYPAQLSSMENIYIRSSLTGQNYQTPSFERYLEYGTAISSTDILARIPLSKAITGSNNEFISWDDPNDTYFILLDQNQLHDITFRITDDSGRVLPEVAPDQSKLGLLSFKMVLRIDIVGNPSVSAQQNLISSGEPLKPVRSDPSRPWMM